MTSINGLTNPFENSILNMNLTQLEKDKLLANYSDAISQGYEPPASVLDEIAALLVSGDLSTEAQARLQELTDLIMAEIGPVITSDGGGDTAQVAVDENTSLVTTITALDQYSLNDGAEALSYSIIGGADAGLFTIDAATGALAFAVAPDFEVPVDFGGDNIYDVNVQVNDGALLLDTQAIQVTVADLNDNAPVITSGAAFGIDEKSSAVTTVTATDADAVGTLGFAIAGGADAGFFTIDAATGALAFAAAPDFEVPGDDGGDNVYDVTVEVSDGVQSDSQALQVTVADVNDNAPVITSGAAFGIDENLTAVTTVTATDVDTVGTLSFAIAGGADAGFFTIDAATGALAFAVAPDFEALADDGGDNIYDVTVEVSDGVQSDTQAIQVTVADLNDTAPVIISGAAFGIDENLTAVTTVTATDADTVGALSFAIDGGADAGLFTIDAATGALAFAAAPDFEAPGDVGGDNAYDVTVKVSDGVQSDTQAIQVTVADVNEGPPPPAHFGAVMNGIDAEDFSGFSVSSAGDVNGDGYDDMLIGAQYADPNGSDSGETYLVYGAASGIPASLDLSTLDGTNGFVMNGIDAFDHSGRSVSSGGDVNGDGFDDMLIGALFADPNGNASGETYLVYGAASGIPASLDLSTLDCSNGLVMNGIDAHDGSGRAVSSAGDVNGDGFDDMLIGADQASPHGNQSGETYLVYGAASGIPANLDLSSLDGSNGFVMNGIDAHDGSGRSVSSAGDVNGDGFDDMLIGAHLSPLGDFSGETYLVYGAASGIPASLDLSSLDGNNGFVMNGIDAYDFSGFSVSSAGDMNGDGFDDMLIGAFLADPNGSHSGETYLVYGAASGIPASLDLSSLDGSNGFVINGIDGGDRSGFSVSSAGDVNGDGFDDMLIGALGADPNGITSGETYLVYGGESILDAFDLADGVQDGSIELSGVTEAFAV